MESKWAKHQKHTTPGIRWSSPTQLLVWRLVAYLGESGRDPELSTISGRMYQTRVEDCPKQGKSEVQGP